MDPTLPTSPFLDRFLAESPWSLALPMLAVAAALAWWGSRNDRVRPILAGVAVLLGAALVLAVAAWRTSPGEHAAARVRALVAAAEAADLDALRACFAAETSVHYGSPEAPADGLDRLMGTAEMLKGRHRIERNDVARLDFATLGPDRGAVILACRTTTASSYGPIPTRWWIEATRGPNGEWRIDRIAWLSVMDRVPERGMR
ncbi:MAG: hypothetical protein RI990_1490 [Planctomycetota bacterium]